MMTFSPILMRIGYGLSWQNAVVAAWGGLRGAVGLALALQVYIDHPLIGGKVRHGTNFNTPAGLEKVPILVYLRITYEYEVHALTVRFRRSFLFLHWKYVYSTDRKPYEKGK